MLKFGQRGLIGTALIALTSVNMAYAQPTQADFERYMTRLDGSVRPELIHEELRLRISVSAYAFMDPPLSDDDRTKVEAHLAGEPAALREDAVRFESAMQSICAEFEHLDAVSLAIREDAAILEMKDRRARRYRSLLQTLSPAAEKTFMAYAEQDAPAKVSGASLDSAKLAADFPEYYKETWKTRCADAQRKPSETVTTAVEAGPDSGPRATHTIVTHR